MTNGWRVYYQARRERRLMKTLTHTLIIAFVIMATGIGRADESSSPYEGLAPVEETTALSPYSFRTRGEDRVDERTPATAGTLGRSPRYSGWLEPENLSPRNTGTLGLDPRFEDSGKVSPGPRLGATTQRTPPAPKVGPNELPYIDAQGMKFKRYAIVLTGPGCHYCEKMKPIIKQLRKEKFMVYMLDTSVFPDLVTKLNRMSKDYPAKIDRAIPWIIIRDNNKTIKMFRGYVAIDKIRPWLVEPKKPEDEYRLTPSAYRMR